MDAALVDETMQNGKSGEFKVPTILLISLHSIKMPQCAWVLAYSGSIWIKAFLFGLREERLSEIFDLLLPKQVYATKIDGVMIGDNIIAQKNTIIRIDIT
jgi:hypothetical protein